jgi:hypothetical protein
MTIKNREIPKIPDSLPLVVNDETAAAILGVSASYLRKSRYEGRIGHRTPPPKHVKIDGRRLYKVVELRAWVDRLESKEAI